MNEHHDEDWEKLLRHELENAPKVRAVLNAYAGLSESEKLLFRLAAGVSLDVDAKSGMRRPIAGPTGDSPDAVRVSPDAAVKSDVPTYTPPTNARRIQPLVQSLMKTLLEDYPTFLSDTDINNLMNRDYIQKILGLQIGGFPLLRKMESGRRGSVNDRKMRYYAKLYAGKFYVCKEWWKKDHLYNARSLLQFVNELADRHPAHPGIPALERHKKALSDYIAQFRDDE